MIRNYFVTAINNLLKHKLFSVINIAGLAIGLAACILIGLYVQNELAYDKQWQDAGRLFKLDTTLDRTGSNPSRSGGDSFLATPLLRQAFADEIEAAARVINFDQEVRLDGANVSVSIPEVDRDVTKVFDFAVLAGSLDSTLEVPGRLALGEATAVRLFGSVAKAMGQTLTVVASGPGAKDTQLTVTAVYRLPAGNSILSLPSLTLLDEAKYPYLRNWLILATNDYVKLRPGIDVNNLLARMPAVIDHGVDISGMQAGPGVTPSQRMRLRLVNIADVYLKAPETLQFGGNLTLVLAFSVISLLVLMIGCTNFTILSTVKATQRAREVALRKVVGARRGELIWQFLGESTLLVALALIVALMLVELLLPVFGNWVGKALQFDLLQPRVWLALLALTLLVSVTGGLYPAFVLSYFRPAATLKANRSNEPLSAAGLRNVLVTFQFAISIALMIATAIVWLQVQYTVNRDPGFDRDRLLVINNLMSRPGVRSRIDTLRQQVAALPGVTVTALSGHQPMQRINLSTIMMPYTLEGGDRTALQLPTLSIDPDFLAAYRIPLLAGRVFSAAEDTPATFFDFTVKRGSEQQGKAIINMAAARSMGFTQPAAALGQRVSTTSAYNGSLQTYTIVGVIGDTQFFGLRTAPRPELYLDTPYFADVLTIRFDGDGRQLLQQVTGIWNKLTDNAALSSSFVDQLLSA
ncbi:MAG TPA: ABC transporter permease, partial [Candidatus Acidoferrum sp.]|nr:ABC transporter permease [Candidatus Acidoferrum sp.]